MLVVYCTSICVCFFVRITEEEGHTWYCVTNILNIARNFSSCILSSKERSVSDKIIFFRWSTRRSTALWILQLEKERAVSLSSGELTTIHRWEALECIRKFYRRSLDTRYQTCWPQGLVTFSPICIWNIEKTACLTCFLYGVMTFVPPCIWNVERYYIEWDKRTGSDTTERSLKKYTGK